MIYLLRPFNLATMSINKLDAECRKSRDGVRSYRSHSNSCKSIFGKRASAFKLVSMMVNEVDDRPSQKSRTCHFASLADVINPFQQVVRQSKSRQAIIDRFPFIAHGC